MSLKRLLRLPGSSCPDQALSGDAILDAYIRDLDSRLLGSRYVRLLTLAEIKNHLQEAKAAAVDEGLDAQSAAAKAVEVVGHPDSYAVEQRATLRSRFWKVAAAAGIPFGIWMAVWPFLVQRPTFGLIGACITGVLEGTFFGSWMGLFVAFIWPQRWLGTVTTTPGQPTIEFVVEYPKPMRRLSGLCFAAFVVLTLVCLLAAVLGALVPGVREKTGIPLEFLVPFTLMSALEARLSLVGLRSYLVRPDGFLVRGFPGSTPLVSWQHVLATGTLGDIYLWIPTWIYCSRVKYLDYAQTGKRPRRVLIYQDMINADRFLQVAEGQLQQNTIKPLPGSSV